MRLSYQTEQEREAFDDVVTLSSGVKYDHRDTLKHINRNKRGKFYKCKDEDAVFWPLGMQRAPHFSKKLDMDTRHFQVEGYGDYNYYQAWACNIRFRKWSRDTGFALNLDDYGEAVTDFGSCVIKLNERKEGGYDDEECDLMKLWFDPTVKSLFKQTKIELHELEKHEVLEKDGWENVKGEDGAWAKAEVVDYEESEKQTYDTQVTKKRKFWERIGYFNVAHYENEDLVNGKYKEEFVSVKEINGKQVEVYKDIDVEDKWKFMHTIHSSTGNGEVIVFAEEIKPEEDLYIDLHISKYEDRWMRIGIYERLFDLQRLVGEVVNYDREAQQIASLLMFRTKGKKLVGSNILQMAKSGLITDADLEQIGITNTFLNDFVVKVRSYEEKADRLCLTPEVLTGEGSEAKTFRGQAALLNVANSAFKKSRDRILYVVSEMLIKRILPHEIKQWNKEKSLEVAGFDIDVQMYDAIAAITNLNEFLEEEFAKGNNPTEEEKQLFIQRLQQTLEREGRVLILPKKFYDFDFGLGIPIEGETRNLEQRNDVYFNAINWVLQNPAVIYIPAFREYIEKNGITPFHLTTEQVQQLQEGQGEPQPVGKQDKLSAQIDTET